MRVISVPDPVQIEAQQAAITFYDFMKMAISSYHPFGNGIDNIEKGLKLKTIVKEAEAKKAKKIYVEDADYDLLKVCVCEPRFDANRNPSPPFVPGASIDMIEFFRSVKNATQEVTGDQVVKP